jgi:hypothetical protein
VPSWQAPHHGGLPGNKLLEQLVRPSISESSTVSASGANSYVLPAA